MKTPETLNAKLADAFLRFAMNNCMSHANKMSNGYGYWNTSWGKKFDESLETDRVLQRRKKIRFENGNQLTDWTKGESFVITSDHMACGSRSKEVLELQGFLYGNDQQQGKLDRMATKDLEDLLTEEFTLELTKDLEAWFLGYLNSDYDAGKRWWLEFGPLRNQDLAFLSC
jgi:hypothetical protein